MNHSGTSAGSATGSSRYQTMSGSASIISCGDTVLTTCRTPMACAVSAATSTSEYPSRSKPVVNAIRFGLDSRASVAVAVESMPPDRNAPTVTSGSEIMCLATESRRTSAISSYSFSGSGTGFASNVGVKYRWNWIRWPGRT
jgi:hypothetical protein